MTACDGAGSPDGLKLHAPVGEESAGEIMTHIADMSAMELASVAKFSGAMAVKAIKLAYEFPDKSRGERAVEAFTGVVFRAFDYSSLDEAEKRRADSDIRLISSLYGWLKPDDIIKAYRLDFNTLLAPEDKPSPGEKPLSAFAKTFSASEKPMWNFWKRDVTISLVKEIKERNGEAVLNLLPGDAAKMIDWKLVKNFAKVWKVDFKELLDGGGWKTPTANRLKELRGHLLREIITRRLESPRDLLALDTCLLNTSDDADD